MARFGFACVKRAFLEERRLCQAMMIGAFVCLVIQYKFRICYLRSRRSFNRFLYSRQSTYNVHDGVVTLPPAASHDLVRILIGDSAISVELALLEVSFVDLISFFPLKPALAIDFVIDELACQLSSFCDHGPFPFFLSVFELSFVAEVAVDHNFSLTMKQSSFELAFIDFIVGPICILPLALLNAKCKLSFILDPIFCVSFSAVSVGL